MSLFNGVKGRWLPDPLIREATPEEYQAALSADPEFRRVVSEVADLTRAEHNPLIDESDEELFEFLRGAAPRVESSPPDDPVHDQARAAVNPLLERDLVQTDAEIEREIEADLQDPQDL